VWDVGHQTYPHKILTGRRDRMDTLRQLGGISGFPRRDESEYDTFGTAHSSTSDLGRAGHGDGGQAKGRESPCVAIIGDGAMTAGMAFEALNNAACRPGGNLLVVLNDNDMSISPPVGALNKLPGALMSGQFYAAPRRRRQERAEEVRRRCSSWPSASRSTPRAWSCRPRCSRSSASTTSARSTATTSTR
jgi:1-deoxy-D-xylulose-5-phosphate synthase